MVRLHVVDDQVVDRPIAEDGADLFEVGVEVAGFDGIYQGGFLVGDQVGVVRDPFRQGPHAFEQSSGAVVYTYVVDVSFERVGGVHGLCLGFKVCIFGCFLAFSQDVFDSGALPGGGVSGELQEMLAQADADF